MAEKNGRMEFIDALRGITILLVVYSHVLTHYYRDIPVSSGLNLAFVSFRMPLFFFISGFFVFSFDYTRELFKKRALNRLFKQLYPTVLAFFLFAWIFYNGAFHRAIRNPLKIGYWFTLTAVEYFFLVTPLLLLLSYKAKNLPRRYYNLILIAFTLAVWGGLEILTPRSGVWGNIAGLPHLTNYYPFFMAGVIFRYNYSTLHPLLTDRYVVLTALAAFLIMHFFFNSPATRIWRGMAAIFALYGLAYMVFSSPKVSRSRISKWLRYIGTMTLEIYLFHYFFLHLAARFTDPSWVGVHINRPWELPLVLLLSVAVALLCLAAVRLMKWIKIHRLIFPATIPDLAMWKKLIYFVFPNKNKEPLNNSDLT